MQLWRAAATSVQLQGILAAGCCCSNAANLVHRHVLVLCQDLVVQLQLRSTNVTKQVRSGKAAGSELGIRPGLALALAVRATMIDFKCETYTKAQSDCCTMICSIFEALAPAGLA